MKQKKVLITGSKGQLGYELKQTCPENIDVYYMDAKELDITDEHAVFAMLNDIRPDIVINAAAYTAVDKAENEQEQCYLINAEAVGYLAKGCQAIQARLIQVSTDFVFDGRSNQPYLPSSKAEPLSVYGASKLAGEMQIQQFMETNYAIVRTAWVYSRHGNNFVKNMLRLMADKPELGVVADQIGCPTWANNLAKVCWQLALNIKLTGTYHYSDRMENAQGISWFEFAKQIQQQAIALGLLKTKIPIQPLQTSDYPTPAMRPAFSVMNTQLIEQQLNIQPMDWRTALTRMLKQL